MLGYGTEDGSVGKEYKINPAHIDPKEIYVDVTLSHHIPTDELGQINAVTILMKEVGISFVDAAKRLGIPNPEELLARKRQEDLTNAAVANRVKLMNAETDVKIMQMMNPPQPEQPAGQGGGVNEQSISNARMANNGQRQMASVAQSLEGQGVNPNRGGLSPNIASPEGNTKEGATMFDRGGEQI